MRLITIGIISLMAAPVAAQDPGFEYAGEEDRKELEKVKGVEWKASAQAGLVVTTGNAESTTASGAATASRKEGNNKVQLDAQGTYVRSAILFIEDMNGNGTIDNENEIRTDSQTTTKSWDVKIRYDRFLSAINSLYAVGKIGANEPAGKELVAGGQAGYSHLIVNQEKHKVTAEAGYDLAYEKFVTAGATGDDDVVIHSARTFLGYAGTVTADTGVAASVETLVNLNEVDLPTGTAEFAEDTRVTGDASLTTKLYKNISFRFGFQVKFDNAPAPRAAIPGAAYGAGFTPEAKKTDTKTEAALIINFL